MPSSKGAKSVGSIYSFLTRRTQLPLHVVHAEDVPSSGFTADNASLAAALDPAPTYLSRTLRSESGADETLVSPSYREESTTSNGGRDRSGSAAESKLHLSPELESIYSTSVNSGVHSGAAKSAHTYLYYQIYSDHRLIPVKATYDPQNNTLGRVLARTIAPPRDILSIKRRIAQVEQVQFDQLGDAFHESDPNNEPLDDRARVHFTAEITTPLSIILKKVLSPTPQPVQDLDGVESTRESPRPDFQANQTGTTPRSILLRLSKSWKPNQTTKPGPRADLVSSERLFPPPAMWPGAVRSPLNIKDAKRYEAQGVYLMLMGNLPEACGILKRAAQLDIWGCHRAWLYRVFADTNREGPENLNIFCKSFANAHVIYYTFGFLRTLDKPERSSGASCLHILSTVDSEFIKAAGILGPLEKQALTSSLVFEWSTFLPNQTGSEAELLHEAKISEARGLCILCLGNFLNIDACIRCLDRALHLDPRGCRHSYLYRAVAHLMAQSDSSVVLQDLKLFAGDDVDAKALLSMMYFTAGYRTAAFKAYLEVLQDDPPDDMDLVNRVIQAASDVDLPIKSSSVVGYLSLTLVGMGFTKADADNALRENGYDMSKTLKNLKKI